MSNYDLIAHFAAFRRHFIPFSPKKEKHSFIENGLNSSSHLLPIATDCHQTLLLKTASAAKNRVIKLKKNMSSTKRNLWSLFMTEDL